MWPRFLLSFCLLLVGCRRGSDEPAAATHTASATLAEPSRTPDAIRADQRFYEALQAARNQPDEQRGKGIRSVFREWAKTDLMAARQAAGSITNEADWLSAHETLLDAALKLNVREAVKWVLSLEPADFSAVLLDQALSAWVDVDASAAGAHVAALPASDYRTVLSGEVAGAWARRDLAAAVTWSGGLSDQEAREEALSAAFEGVLNTEPRRAAELALRVPGEGDRAMMLERVVAAWWAHDPASVKAWHGQLPNEAVRTQVGRLLAAKREAQETTAAGVTAGPRVE